MYEFTNVNDEKDRKLEFSLYEVTEDFSISRLCEQFINMSKTIVDVTSTNIGDTPSIINTVDKT